MWQALIPGLAGVTNDLIFSTINAVRQKKNYDNELEQQQWQKAQVEIDRQREDTAVQRRVADLEAAGLHPALAAGSAATAHSAPQISPPRKGMLDSPEGEMELANIIMNLMSQKANIAKTNAETANIARQMRHYDAMDASIRANMQHLRAMDRRLDFQNSLDLVNESHRLAEIEELKARRDTILHNLNKARERGLMTTESSEWIRMLEYVENIITKLINSRRDSNRNDAIAPTAPEVIRDEESKDSGLSPFLRRLFNRNPRADMFRIF